MQPYQQRVLDEYAALDEKAKSLYVFFVTKTFESLDKDEKDLLRMQYYTMMVYVGILQRRIAKF